MDKPRCKDGTYTDRHDFLNDRISDIRAETYNLTIKFDHLINSTYDEQWFDRELAFNLRKMMMQIYCYANILSTHGELFVPEFYRGNVKLLDKNG